MTATTPLICPSCQTTLNVPTDIGHLTCTHCNTPYIVNRSVGIAYLQPVEEPDAVSPTMLDTSERIQALHTQLDQLQEELAYLAKNPPREGLIGKKVGLGLFAISFGLVVVVLVVVFVLAIPDFWQGILGGAVILAVLGIIFYGDGRKTYATVCTRYHQRIETLRDLQQAGEDELARLDSNEPRP